MRNFLKKIYYQINYKSGISDFLIKRKLKQNKLVLTYHNVLPDNEISNFFTNNVDLSVDVFKKHLDILQNEYRISDINTLNDSKKNDGLYLSFDDAMLNNIEIIEPILDERGIKAMFAACTGLLSNDISNIWRDEIFLILRNSINNKLLLPDNECLIVNKYNLNKWGDYITNKIESQNQMNYVYEYLTNIKEINNINYTFYSKLRYDSASLEDLKFLKKKGHKIVSHTHTHKKLSYLRKTDQFLELEKSKEYFDRNLEGTDTIVYPYGTFKEVSSLSLELAKNLGYKYGFLNFQNKKETKMSISRLNLTNIKKESVFKGVLAGINRI